GRPAVAGAGVGGTVLFDDVVGFTDVGGGGGSVLALVLRAVPVAAALAALVALVCVVVWAALVEEAAACGPTETAPAAPPTPPAAHALEPARSAIVIDPMMLRILVGATRRVPRARGGRQRVKVPSGAEASTLPCAAGVGSRSCTSISQ